MKKKEKKERKGGKNPSKKIYEKLRRVPKALDVLYRNQRDTENVPFPSGTWSGFQPSKDLPNETLSSAPMDPAKCIPPFVSQIKTKKTKRRTLVSQIRIRIINFSSRT